MKATIQFIDNNKLYKYFEKVYGRIPKITDTISIITSGELMYFKFRIFEDMDWITQCFSTRLGGVSNGIYQSMNLTYGRDDDPDNVRTNFEIIGKAIGVKPSEMVYSKQTHTSNVLKVTKKHCGLGVVRPHEYDNVDGLVTNEPNVCLVTAYADCIPVIVADTTNKVIGAAHAGWRGTVGNIVSNMLDCMKNEFNTDPTDVKAFVGPGICENCYEVSSDVADEFKQHFTNEEVSLFLKNGVMKDKYQLNLPMANVINLYNAGVDLDNIAVSDICTCCNPQILFSHRATNGQRGILCNFISIKNNIMRCY